MKLCQKHHANLVEQIKRKGMYRLVSQDSREAAARAERWLKGVAQIDELDPLTVSTLEIYQKAYNILGDWVNQPQYCALCEVEKHFRDHGASDVWIDNVTDAVLLVCTANNLLKSH